MSRDKIKLELERLQYDPDSYDNLSLAAEEFVKSKDWIEALWTLDRDCFYIPFNSVTDNTAILQRGQRSYVFINKNCWRLLACIDLHQCCSWQNDIFVENKGYNYLI